ncbi:MAG: hypothetical protein IID44_15850 [Planctomycetes bacterium]|nr:hypothetical protein [Planctomycetota bacterium]
MQGLLTISDLHRITGKPIHTINYALARHGPLPIGRVGILRVWNQANVPEVQRSLEECAKLRKGKGKSE